MCSACGVSTAGFASSGPVLAARASATFRPTTPPPSSSEAAAAPAPKPAPPADAFEHIDLPALDDSDALARQRIGALSSHPLVKSWLATKALIRNFVVVVENISHGTNPSGHL